MKNHEVKERITKLLRANLQSGFLTQEIVDLLDLKQMDVARCLFDNDCFYYDEEGESYTGWKIKV